MAYAIIKTGGKQYKVAEGDVIDIEKIDVAPDAECTFSDVLLHSNGDEIKTGSPVIEGASVTGKVLDQHKDRKVIAYRFKRRKGYHRTVGHRRQLTKVKIEKISA